MILSKVILEPTSGNIECQALYEVQGKVITISFSLNEEALIENAVADGRYTWDNIDIKTLGEPILDAILTY